jgi:hypothetical protein
MPQMWQTDKVTGKGTVFIQAGVAERIANKLWSLDTLVRASAWLPDEGL